MINALMIELIVWGDDIGVVIILEKRQHATAIPIVCYSSAVIDMSGGVDENLYSNRNYYLYVEDLIYSR